MTLIRLIEVDKSFVKGGKYVPILRSVSLTFNTGEFVCLVGPNGSGKSTLLNLIAGVLPPDAGSIVIDVGDARRPFIGYAWQDYRSSLLPWRTAIANLTFPLEIRGVEREQRQARAHRLLESFAPDVPPNQPVGNLSGGQQQLISVLRSFIADPDLVLLDEPLSALDQYRRWLLGRHIEQVWAERQPPTVLVSHDVDEAVLLADRIILLGPAGSGEVRELANDAERPRTIAMLTDPRHVRLRNVIVEHLNAANQSRG